jgi:hypothetical protein
MNRNNRLTEYFAEIAEIAKVSSVKAIQLQHEHLQIFRRNDIVTSADGLSGFSSCFFDDSGPSTHINGQFYDQNMNLIDLEDDGYDGVDE